MPESSLREIQQTLAKLWSSRESMQQFLSGDAQEVQPDFAREVDRERLQLYSSILRHGHQDSMTSIYPLCAKVLGKDWESLVVDFLEQVPCGDYRLTGIGSNFPGYVKTNPSEKLGKLRKRLPYLADLANYEWLEMEVNEIEDEPVAPDPCNLREPEEFTNFYPIVNPALILRVYEYPVFQLAERIERNKHAPKKAELIETFAACYFDPVDMETRFVELGSSAYAILQKACHEKAPYTDLAALAISLSPEKEADGVADEFLMLVSALQSNRVLLGSKEIVAPHSA